MADSNLLNRSLQHGIDNHGIDGGDPFAELTRIMGRDTRVDVPETADPFDIDLEKELMGGFDEGLADGPAPAAAIGHADGVSRQPVDDTDAALAAHAPDDDFSAEFDNVDWSEDGVAETAEPFAEMPVDEMQVAANEEQALPAGRYAVPAEPYEASWQRAASHAAPSDDPFGDDLGLAEVDMDFGELDVDDRAHDAASAEDPFEDDVPTMTGHPEADDRGAVMADSSEDRMSDAGAPSLEDELSMLLGTGGRLGAEPGAASATEMTSDAAYERTDYAAYGEASDAPFDDEAEPQLEAWQEEPAAMEDVAVAPEPAADPFAVFSRLAPAMPVFRHSSSGTVHAATPDAAGQADMLDVDTVDVAQDHVPHQDDIDLPETDFDDPAPAPALAYDDYEAEFAPAFGTTRAEEAHPAAAAGSYGDDQFAEALGLSGAAATSAASGWGARTYAPEQPSGGGEELEREIGVESYGNAVPPRARRRNGLVVAAAVAAIALLGGLGAFALSFGGGDASDAPVLVKADGEPLKVKPENPGGTTVPNQDSKAYERASGVVDNTPPAQETLVTTREEPVTLASAEESDRMLPGLEDDGQVDADGVTASKSEDRLEPVAQPDGVGATEDLAAVQPRKVRTMVVRPDGTLVPREEPAPAAAPQTAPAAAAPQVAAATPPADTASAIAAPAAEAIGEVAAKPLQAPAGAAAAATAVVSQAAAQPKPATQVAERAVVPPATGPIVPQRPTDETVNVVSKPAVAAQQVAQAAAPARAQPARPVAVAPEGASDWSMQIASQPTAEAAQSSYQNLARRYGGVIGGRGVNIVKADIAGKGTYYRVRIPSATRDEAIALCEKYKAAGGNCFVSK